VYEKTSYQFQIKFITEDYYQKYKTLQLYTSIFKFNTNKFTAIKVIKNAYIHTQRY